MPTPQISTFEELQTFITTNFPDNNSGLIDPEDIRVALRSFVDIQSLKNDLMTASLSPEQAAVWQELINKLDQIQRESRLNITGTAKQGNTPTRYDPVNFPEDAERYPDGLFEIYQVRNPITSPNSWGNETVTQAELNDNLVYFDVDDGVITKSLSLKVGFDITKKQSVNLLNPAYIVDSTVIDSGGNVNTNPTTFAGFKSVVGLPISTLVGQSITISGITPGSSKQLAFKDASNVLIGTSPILSTIPKTLTVPTGASTLSFTSKASVDAEPSAMLNVGATALPYELFGFLVEKIDSNTIVSKALSIGNFVPDPITPNNAVNKKYFDSLTNLQKSNEIEEIPYNKLTETFPSIGDNSTLYGFTDSIFSLNNFISFNIIPKAIGLFTIEFRDASDINNILHTYNGEITTVALTEITKASINFPNTISQSKKIVPFVKNNVTQIPNVFQFNNSNPSPKLWYAITGSTITEYTTTVKASFNFWIKQYKSIPIIDSVLSNNYDIELLKEEVEAISSIGNLIYSYTDNPPILPSNLFVLEDNFTRLSKNSMFTRFRNAVMPEMFIVSNSNYINITDASKLNYSDLGTTARLIVNQHSTTDKLIYKDINVIKSSLSDKVGKTVKVLSLGDSLTEGGNGFNNSPIYLLTQELTAKGITVQGIGTLQRTSGAITQRNEGRGAWRYRTFVGLESKFSNLNVIIPHPTKNVWIEGTDGTISEIKANNAFLYLATPQDKIDNPQWCFNFVVGGTVNNKSYEQDNSLGDYYIFSPARYFSERGISVPDIVTIALGTNEWYLEGFSGWDLPLISSCVKFMIKRFREALPNAKIVVIPCNNMPLTRETEWQQKMSYLTASVINICDDMVLAGDTNLFTLSIFAQGTRALAYNSLLSSAKVGLDNSVKVGTIDNDVHMLNIADDSRNDYMKCYTDAIISLA